MPGSRFLRAFALVISFLVGSAIGLKVYSLLLAPQRHIQLRNISETLGLVEQTLKSFDLVATENVAQVLFRADYVTGLKITTGSGFVVFDQRKQAGGITNSYSFSAERDNGERRPVGSVDIEIVHDPKASRNIAISCLTSGLLCLLLVWLVLAARTLKRELGVRQASEAALSEQERNLRVLLNSLTEAVIATDSVGRVAQMNPVAERLTGWSLPEAAGKPIDDVFRLIDSTTRAPLASKAPADAGPALDDDHQAPATATLVGRYGGEHQIAQSFAPMLADTSQISGVVHVFRDVTAELQAQQRMREMEKMQAIGVLSGGIAHDFNNLLGVISASAEVISLKDRNTLTPSSSKLLGNILTATRRGADLTSRLLAVGSTSKQEAQPFSVHAAINNVIALLSRTIDKRFDIEVDLKADHDEIMGNLAFFESALLNIGVNAIQAMCADRGSLRIETRTVELNRDDFEIRTYGAPVGHCIVISLRDDGIGIPPESLRRVFEPFFTNRRGGGGTGLGLWAVYNTVRDHGGVIHVESQVGVETNFVIHLPICCQAVAAACTDPTPFVPMNKTILVVDDEDDLRTTLADMLMVLGCRPLVAASGAEAIRLFEKEQRTIDAVLMDLNMPDMSGEDAIVGIHKISRDVPVIISSGYPVSEQGPQHQYLAQFLCLKKPYLLADLDATLKSAFGNDSRDGADQPA